MKPFSVARALGTVLNAVFSALQLAVIYAPFSAESEKTASEILDPNCKGPAKLEKMVQQLTAKPLIDRRPAGSRTQQHAPADDFDDQSIPF